MGYPERDMATGQFEAIDGGASSANIPVSRQRGLTGLIQAGEKPASTSTVLLLILMLGGGIGGGAGWGAAVFSGGRDIDDVQEETANLRNDVEALTDRLETAERERAEDARQIRTQLAYQRWIVTALQSNNAALGAIVKAQDLDVDVTLPSLDLDDVLGTRP